MGQKHLICILKAKLHPFLIKWINSTNIGYSRIQVSSEDNNNNNIKQTIIQKNDFL